MNTPEDIAGFLATQPHIVSVLEHVEALDLPDCWVAAGLIRNAIWDRLSGIPVRLETAADVDVVYFNPADLGKDADQAHEARLRAAAPTLEWEVRNQARMHLKNGDEPYADTEDGLRHFLETVAAIGARLREGRIELIAPYGVDDILKMILRPTASGRARPHEYLARLERKRWHEIWPKLEVLTP
ncbi:MAG: nucleotidyltransferase family protein [Pseudomonadota bacterium]